MDVNVDWVTFGSTCVSQEERKDSLVEVEPFDDLPTVEMYVPHGVSSVPVLHLSLLWNSNTVDHLEI